MNNFNTLLFCKGHKFPCITPSLNTCLIILLLAYYPLLLNSNFNCCNPMIGLIKFKLESRTARIMGILTFNKSKPKHILLFTHTCTQIPRLTYLQFPWQSLTRFAWVKCNFRTATACMPPGLQLSSHHYPCIITAAEPVSQ